MQGREGGPTTLFNLPVASSKPSCSPISLAAGYAPSHIIFRVCCCRLWQSTQAATSSMSSESGLVRCKERTASELCTMQARDCRDPEVGDAQFASY
jgi:hypothetical protein